MRFFAGATREAVDAAIAALPGESTGTLDAPGKSQVKALKVSRRTRVFRILGARFPGGSVVLKECKSFWTEKLQDFFYHGRARQAWIAALGFELRGLGTPRALALVEDRRGGVLRRAILIFEDIGSGRGLDVFLKSSSRNPREEGRLAEWIGRQVGALHAQEVYHRDLKPANLMVREDGARDASDFLFLDLDDTFFWRRLTWRRRCSNLGQLAEGLEFAGLALRPALRGRFLRGYLAAQGSMNVLRHGRRAKGAEYPQALRAFRQNLMTDVESERRRRSERRAAAPRTEGS